MRLLGHFWLQRRKTGHNMVTFFHTVFWFYTLYYDELFIFYYFCVYVIRWCNQLMHHCQAVVFYQTDNPSYYVVCLFPC